ncbi:dynein regulatory complex protein 11-like, partial [Chiloscyllium plagiosum]|uniref:dynein regulatory complex protein 11-like n=1 Tax=Chiloscyllium plagiosum TaxID=36176 RepID=UPI001CB842AC
PKPEGFSYFLPEIIEGNKIYTDVWRERDESTNHRQKHDVELEKEEKRKEVEKEIRLQVDELMREELRNLRMAVERDFSDPPKAKVKPKKAKGKEKGSKKKEKDFTANRSLNSLCDELIEQGLLKAAPQVPLASYLGDFSYLGSTLLSADINPMPSLYDIRQIITMYAILPLGSQPLHEKAPLVKSILLAGPHGVGKKMLVHSICTESCATLFDLTAKNIAGKYPGKAGLQMMLHMVLKVGPLTGREAGAGGSL